MTVGSEPRSSPLDQGPPGLTAASRPFEQRLEAAATVAAQPQLAPLVPATQQPTCTVQELNCTST